MRRLTSAVAGTAVLLTGLVGLAPPRAAALSGPVAFSAENLSTWQTNGVVYALGASKGKIVAGGTFSQLRPPSGGSGTAVSTSALAVLNGETGAPDSCQLSVTLSGGTATVRAIVPSADGNTVYIGGNFSNVGGTSVSRVAAIDVAACTVKPLRVSSVSSTVYGMALSGNSLYLAGAFKTVAGQTRTQFAAVNATTGALLPFNPTVGLSNRAASVTTNGRAVAVSPDGSKVALGGDFDTINGADSHSVAVVDATGSTLRAYGYDFFHRDSVTKALTTGGDTVYGGNEGTGGGVFDGRFALDWNTLDQKWRDTCLGATQAVLPYNGVLYAASHAHDCNSMGEFQDGSRNYFTAQDINAPASLFQWFPKGNDGTGEGIGPRAIAIATANGKNYLWYGGEFTKINNGDQQGLTRFGTADTNAPPVPTAYAEALTSNAIQVRFRSVVDTDDSDLTYRVYRNGATTPIWTGTAKSYWWVRPQVTFVDSSVTPGTTYSYRVTASDGTNVSTLSASTSAKAATIAANYPAKVIGDGASLYWRYDETTGTLVQDKSGQTVTGRNGLYEQGVTLGGAGAVGDASKSASFDGVDDYAWNDQLASGPKTYSVETWFKTDTTRGGKIVGYGSGRPRTDNGNAQYSSSYDRHIYMEDSGRLDFGAYNGNTNVLRTAKSYNDNQWHHVVGTQSSAGMRFYVDGVLAGKNSVADAQDYLGTWRVGGDNLNGWPSQPSSQMFAGSIDETAVYGTALSAAQIAGHYEASGRTVTSSAPTDAYGKAVVASDPDLFWRLDETSGNTAADSSSAGGNAGAIGSGVQLGSAGKVGSGKSVTTGGGDALVVSPQTSSTNAFSVEAWIKTTTTDGGKIIGFEDASSGNGNSYDKQVYMANDGTLLLGAYNGSVQVAQSAKSYNDGTWHHVVGTQNGDGMKLYVDGAVVATNATTTNQGFNGFWRIGGGNLNYWPSQPNAYNFAGQIDEAAVYSTALSSTEVASHYNAG